MYVQKAKQNIEVNPSEDMIKINRTVFRELPPLMLNFLYWSYLLQILKC